MTVDLPFKKTKLASMPAKQICTHSGSFHADESLAVYMLKLLPEYKDATVVRSRKQEDWDASDIVVDVSAQYDGVKYFDHHQREFQETFSAEYKTKLSSAGLVYKHFGKQIIQAIVNDKTTLSEEDSETLYQRVYKQFIEALDANDNGIGKYDLPDDQQPKFTDSAISLPGMISKFNPSWNAVDTSDRAFDSQFALASEFIGTQFVKLVEGYALSWLPAKILVSHAIEDRFNVDKSGKIIVLKQFCPWKEHLYTVEEELNLVGAIEFVIFQDSTGSCRVSTVPISSTSFKFRKGLPEPLRGLRDDELSDKSGVPDCIFIHAAGFIGGAKTLDSALKLAQLSLKE